MVVYTVVSSGRMAQCLHDRGQEKLLGGQLRSGGLDSRQRAASDGITADKGRAVDPWCSEVQCSE